MCYNQTGDISTLDGTPLKLVDKFTYLGSSVKSTEKDIDTRLTKAWTAINRLSIIPIISKDQYPVTKWSMTAVPMMVIYQMREKKHKSTTHPKYFDFCCFILSLQLLIRWKRITDIKWEVASLLKFELLPPISLIGSYAFRPRKSMSPRTPTISERERERERERNRERERERAILETRRLYWGSLNTKLPLPPYLPCIVPPASVNTWMIYRIWKPRQVLVNSCFQPGFLAQVFLATPSLLDEMLNFFNFSFFPYYWLLNNFCICVSITVWLTGNDL